MSITETLQRRPNTLPPTLPLTRVKDFARGKITSPNPLYLGSHWRKCRSYPCLSTLLTTCPWCASSERRDHAYFACILTDALKQTQRRVLEVPANAIPPNVVLYDALFTATRRSKRAPVVFEIHERTNDALPPTTPADAKEILRTIAKVYQLPDPLSYYTETEWLLAVQQRVDHPDYTPAKTQDS